MKCARKLAREDVAYARSERFVLLAAVARAKGDLERSVAHLDQAIAASTEAELGLSLVAQRHAKGLLVGGDEGAALVRRGARVRTRPETPAPRTADGGVRTRFRR